MTHHLPQAKARKKLGIPEPVLEFLVKPEDWRKLTWTVKVFRTRGQMCRYLCFAFPEIYRPKEVYAFTDRNTREVIFCLWTCTDNCVGHEMFHLVAAWAADKRLAPEHCLEWDHRTHERMAEAHGNLVSSFWENFARAGFERKECWGCEKPKAKGFYLDRRIY